MKKYKLISKANTSGYKKFEDERAIRGFPEVELHPSHYKGKIYVPTGYVCYEEILPNSNSNKGDTK